MSEKTRQNWKMSEEGGLLIATTIMLQTSLTQLVTIVPFFWLFDQVAC